jgi:hypothetical protein
MENSVQMPIYLHMDECWEGARHFQNDYKCDNMVICVGLLQEAFNRFSALRLFSLTHFVVSGVWQNATMTYMAWKKNTFRNQCTAKCTTLKSCSLHLQRATLKRSVGISLKNTSCCRSMLWTATCVLYTPSFSTWYCSRLSTYTTIRYSPQYEMCSLETTLPPSADWFVGTTLTDTSVSCQLETMALHRINSIIKLAGVTSQQLDLVQGTSYVEVPTSTLSCFTFLSFLQENYEIITCPLPVRYLPIYRSLTLVYKTV